ncbi:docking protein [Elephant endotheliotropic herpesvirus 3B]|nr:docking protein [Elephant endotheliotropic herpesvirus 3B]
MCTITSKVYKNLIQKTRNIFRLSESEIRCTDYNLVIKNPTYPICDIILVPGRVYNVEYVLNYWNSVIPAEYNAVFILKHTGANISMSCFVTLEKDLVDKPLPNEISSPINFLNINDLVVLTLPAIERLKPSKGALLTKCSVQRSYNHHNVFVAEFIVYGPTSESTFNELMHDISGKLQRLSPLNNAVLSKSYRTAVSGSSALVSRHWHRKKHEIVKPTIYCTDHKIAQRDEPISTTTGGGILNHNSHTLSSSSVGSTTAVVAASQEPKYDTAIIYQYARYIFMAFLWILLVIATRLVYKMF